MAFERSGGFRGGNDRRGGFGGGDRPRFATKGFGGQGNRGRDDRGPVKMHAATCAECQKPCEVPFRPNGERPVYCKDCFGEKRGSFDGADTRREPQTREFTKREFTPRTDAPAFAPKAAPVAHDNRIDDLKRQVESMGRKLDTIVSMIEGLALAPVAAKAPEVKKVAAPEVKKAVAVAKKPAVKPAQVLAKSPVKVAKKVAKSKGKK